MLPFVALDAASNTEMPSLFTTLPFAPFSTSIWTTFSNPLKKWVNVFWFLTAIDTYESNVQFPFSEAFINAVLPSFSVT